MADTIKACAGCDDEERARSKDGMCASDRAALAGKKVTHGTCQRHKDLYKM